MTIRKLEKKISVKKENTVSEETGGKWIGKIGIIALICGVSFFLKWAFDNNYIGVVGRIMIGLAAGVSLIGLGQYLRSKYLTYSNLLSGGGIGVLYLTIYAAFSFYHLISQPMAFAFMAVVTILSVVLSIVGGTIHLAAVGVFGGFITPVLLSTGRNDLFPLMGYITLLDLGILAVAFARHWLPLNYLGFFGTVAIFNSWFFSFYTERQISYAILFLTVFFVIYLFASILHHLVRQEKTAGLDLFLITANAAYFSYMLYGMLDPHYHYALGFISVALALVYFFLSYASGLKSEKDQTLTIYLIGISVIFLTLAIPLQLSGFWITLAWLVEAIVIFAVSFETSLKEMRAFGFIVFAIGVIRYLVFESHPYSYSDYNVIFNKYFLVGLAVIAVSYLVSAIYHKYNDPAQKDMRTVVITMLIFANILTLFTGTVEIYSFYQNRSENLAKSYSEQINRENQFGSGNTIDYYSTSNKTYQDGYSRQKSLSNERNTLISILWAMYAVLLVIVGFVRKSRSARLMGVVLFFCTAVKVFMDVWSLGSLYRVVSFIGFGIIALVASFLYSKYQHQLKEII